MHVEGKLNTQVLGMAKGAERSTDCSEGHTKQCTKQQPAGSRMLQGRCWHHLSNVILINIHSNIIYILVSAKSSGRPTS